MKRYFLFVLIFIGLIISSPNANSQGRKNFNGRYTPPFGVLSLTGGLGLAYHYGDLNDKIGLKHLGLGPSISLGALYRITEHFSARGELRFYQVSGNQQYSKYPVNNLSFRTRNPDLNVGVQADLYAYNRHAKINPYLFLGVGVTHLNPKTKLDGKWYSLAPLTTEAVKYNRLPLVITGAIGVSVQVTDRLSLGVEMNNNFLRSDYLDDVSTVYPNPDDLPSDLARRLSDRSSELGLPPVQPGWHRGVGDRNDFYSFLQVRGTWLIGNRMQALERKRMRCPKF